MSEFLEIERKWLIPDEFVLPRYIESRVMRITQMYLVSDKRERLRIIYDGITTRYIHTVKRPAEGGGNWEWEKEIAPSEFYSLTARIDPSCQVLTKERTVFWWEGKKYELDVFIHPVSFQILEVEIKNKDEEVIIPSFITRAIEVTDIKGFSNKRIASKPEVANKKAKEIILQ